MLKKTVFFNKPLNQQTHHKSLQLIGTPIAKARWERQMQDYFGEDWDGLKLERGEEMVG